MKRARLIFTDEEQKQLYELQAEVTEDSLIPLREAYETDLVLLEIDAIYHRALKRAEAELRSEE